jgi:DNA-binding transcriptional LysR family regulator
METGWLASRSVGYDSGGTPMRLEVLRYFLEIAHSGSVRKASERVNITPSALSRHIMLLEHTVGAPLFERHARGMSLTIEGQILQKYAQRTVSNVDLVKSAVAEIRGLQSGSIRVFAIEIVASSVLFPMIREFLSQHSGVNVQVEIITRSNADVLHALSRDEADIGVMYKLNPASDLDYFGEFETPFAVIASPEHPFASKKQISVAELVGTSIATLGRENATRRIVEKALASIGAELDYTLQVNSIEMAKEFARTGMGITVLPSIAAKVECSTGALVAIPLSDWALRRVRVALCTHRAHTVSKTVAAFLELLRQRFDDTQEPRRQCG